MKIPPRVLDEIRARIPVSAVVSRHLQHKKAGREWRGLSPFKQERTPSFFVNDQKGFYHCFASGEHGDIFTFLIKVGGLTFPEAVEELAREAGVPLPKLVPSSPVERSRQAEQESERDRLLQLLEAAQAYFLAHLAGSEGTEARRYLAMRRGLRPETVATFGIGYAPPARHGLRDHLAAKGYSHSDMILSGMLIGGEDIAVPYDRFRHRVMFPITDLKGRIIAFGGRALDPDASAKYLNSPETPLFHKGSILFNAHRARTAAHSSGRIVAVEGYMDVVALSEAGIGEAVAPLGTALTEEQARLLWRLSDEPILCFDGDAAGRKAAFRAIDTVLPHLKPGTSMRFAFLPDGMDPDDLIRRDGRSGMESVLSKTQSLIDVLWEREWGAGEWNTPERRGQLEVGLTKLAGRIGDTVVRAHYSRELRNRMFQVWGRQGRPIRADYRRNTTAAHALPHSANHQPHGGRINSTNTPYFPAPPEPSRSLRQSRLAQPHHASIPAREAILLLALINHPWLLEHHSEDVAGLDLSDPRLSAVREAMLTWITDRESACSPLDSASLRAHLASLDLGKVVATIERAVTHRADRFAMPDADGSTVAHGWMHALELHRRQIGLQRALDRALAAFEVEQTDANFEAISEIKAQMSARVALDEH